jgi:hypothetical protein
MSREAMQMALEALESDPISHAGLVIRKQAITALRQALGAEQKTAVSPGKGTGFNYFRASAITVLRQAQEPVAWRTFDGEGGYDYRSYEMNENYDKEWVERNPNHAHWVEPLYTSPPKREWVGLTDDEVNELVSRFKRYSYVLLREVEAKLKEKNHG